MVFISHHKSTLSVSRGQTRILTIWNAATALSALGGHPGNFLYLCHSYILVGTGVSALSECLAYVETPIYIDMSAYLRV